MKKKKSPLGTYVKDVATFSAGSMVIGASTKATAPFGVSAGVTQLASGSRAIAPLIPMKASIGMLGNVAQTFKPKKRR